MSVAQHQATEMGRKRLSGMRERRGSQTGLSTLGTFIFGALFVATGTGIILVGTQLIPIDESKVHAPWWVLTLCGAVFALGGLTVWGMAWKQYRANSHLAELASHYRDEPAMADYPWNPRFFDVPRWRRARNALMGALFFTLFLSLFNWWAFFANGPWPVKAIVVAFDLFALAAWWHAAVLFGRAIKFGGSRLEFTRFPLRLGEPVVLYWQTAARIGQPTKGTFTLRCVEESTERRSHGKNRSEHTVHHELWSATRDMEGKVEMGKRIELRFELPPEVPPTLLRAPQPVFWELEAKLEFPGLDFEEIYLVPIYGVSSGS